VAIWTFSTFYNTPLLILTTDIINGSCLPGEIWSSQMARETVPLAVALPLEYVGPLLVIVFFYGRIYFALKAKATKASNARGFLRCDKLFQRQH
jgi:hypothetical protein